MPDSFPESGTKTLVSMNVYAKPGKQLSYTILCQNNFITSTTFVVFLPICLAIDESHLH